MSVPLGGEEEAKMDDVVQYLSCSKIEEGDGSGPRNWGQKGDTEGAHFSVRTHFSTSTLPPQLTS
jgi:hypothetical protein